MIFNYVIPLWKPLNWTSFDVVKKIRSKIRPVKVGHAGTLDPFAEGVLMICTGKKTKSIEYFMDQKKVYIAEIFLGSETDTLDFTGRIIKTAPIHTLNEGSINNILIDFIGDIMQEPPMFSALKYNGQRLYKLARQGIVVPRKKRLVKIYDIKLLDFTADSIKIKVICGRGTYIRSLSRDIARRLGTVGHLKSLKRTRIGNFNENVCITIKEFPKWLSVRV